LLLETLDALADGEVLLLAVGLGHEEAPCLSEVGVLSNLKVAHSGQLLRAFLMERQQLLNEVVVIVLQAFAVLLQVKDRPRLALHLVDVCVVDSGDLKSSAGTLGARLSTAFLLSLPSDLLLLLYVTELRLNTELVVAALLLPEGLELFASGAREGKLLALSGEFS
jgi:hypothetical protein